MARDIESKILKLMGKREPLEIKRKKINEDIKKIDEQLKSLQIQQEKETLEKTLVLLKNKNISLEEIAKQIESGKFDYLKEEEGGIKNA